MTKNLMIISTHESFYGSIKGASSFINKYVAKIFLSEWPGEESQKIIKDSIDRYNIKGIITRGYWALFMEKHFDIPIFPLKLDAYDMLLNLDSLMHKGFYKVGLLSIVPTHINPYTFGKIEIFDFHSTQSYLAHIRNDEEMRYVLDRMSSIYGVEVVIGDAEVRAAAGEAGLIYFPLQLSSAFLISTIEDAENMTNRIEREKNHTEYIETLTNIISECSIFTNEHGQITFFNLRAGNAFKLSDGQLVNIQNLIHLSKEDLLKEQANRMVEINDKNYIMNVMPITLHERRIYSFLFSDTQNIEHVEISIRRQSHENGLVAKHSFEDIIYGDAHTANIINMSKRYASSDGTVLITGDSGVGKEVYANAIHNESPRKNGPFVAINCAIFNETLIESELFGYEKGTFTGALTSGKKGLFELAHRGTIFLDEIGELPISMQAKLLRVLQEHEIRHLGGSKIIPVDVRIIAATNKNLRRMITEGTFREDLFFRLSLLELSIPPLRERPMDIIPIFKYFLNRLIEKSGKKIYWTEDSVFDPLLDYEWPGNIRELENIAERTILLTDTLHLTADFIRNLVQMAAQNTHSVSAPQTGFAAPIQPDLNVLEGQYIDFLLKQFNNDKDRVCQYLNISKPTLWRKLAYTKKPVK